jgi:hypothetical protein
MGAFVDVQHRKCTKNYLIRPRRIAVVGRSFNARTKNVPFICPFPSIRHARPTVTNFQQNYRAVRVREDGNPNPKRTLRISTAIVVGERISSYLLPFVILTGVSSFPAPIFRPLRLRFAGD